MSQQDTQKANHIEVKNRKNHEVGIDENNIEFTDADMDIELEVIKKTLKEQEEQNEEYLDRLQRTMAEFDNFRKRTAKEKTSMYQMGTKETIEKLLPVIDNFERALANTKEQEELNIGFAQGIEMIYRQLMSILEDIGVKSIEALGCPFDPNYHNAVTHVENKEYGENEVIEEFQKGYLYQDQVIRYSMVTVAN